MAGRGAQMRGETLRGFGVRRRKSPAGWLPSARTKKPGIYLKGPFLLHTVYDISPRVKRKQIPLCARPRGVKWQ
jgi:hypothetical protein